LKATDPTAAEEKRRKVMAIIVAALDAKAAAIATGRGSAES
jgi:hypothetical protein